MKYFYSTLISVALIGLTGSCFSADSSWTSKTLRTTAGTSAFVPRVTGGKDGSVYLSWIEPSGGHGNAFRFSIWKEGKWSATKTVAAGPEIIGSASSPPGIMELPDGALVAQWLTTASEKDANHILVAVSRDAGATWTKPVKPYHDGTPGEHMYVSLFPWPNGGTGIAWLDPRNKNATALMQTTLDESGRVGPEHQLDGQVCDCCPTSAAITDHGPVLLYRGRTAAEIRDMHLAFLQPDQAAAPVLVHADNWKIDGCPTNSGDVAARGAEVAAVWFTAAGGRKRLPIAFSNNSGRDFSTPLIVDDAAPVGRPSVALLAGGSALVAWIGHATSGANVFIRQASTQAGLGQKIAVAPIAAGGSFGFPFVVAFESQAMLVWSDSGDEKPTGIHAALLERRK